MLCNLSTESFVVRTVLADMVITFIAEILTFGEVILSDGVKCFVIEIFREPAKSSESLIFTNREMFKLIFYS